MIKNTDSASQEQQNIDEQVSIERSYIVDTKISVDHLICSICHYVVWQPVSCGSAQGCQNTFCNLCIQSWLQRPKLGNQNGNIMYNSCPHCKKQFIKTQIPPIMIAMLNSLTLKCKNHQNGCEQTLKYQSIVEHQKLCKYKMKICPGCKNQIVSYQLESHLQTCDELVIHCDRCNHSMIKGEFKKHNSQPLTCLEYQYDSFTQRVDQLQSKIQRANKDRSHLEFLTGCLLSGESLDLDIQLYTPFVEYFSFLNPVSLIKPSFNQIKKKNDFLHFYVINPIYTNSMVSRQWTIKVNRMNGSILIGFCSNMHVNSLDFIINKYGELKRKDLNQSKYRIIRKSENFSFSGGDVLKFHYKSLKRLIKIVNQTKRLQMDLGTVQIDQIGNRIFTFFSMENPNDSLTFI